MNNDDIKYDYWWAGMPRSFHSGVREIADAAGSAKRLYEMDKEELTGIKGISEKYAEDIIRKRREWDVDAEYEKLLRSGIRFIPWYDPEYPARLSDTAGAPFALFVYGDVPEDDRLSVALIGARNCSEYGRMTAEKFGCGLAEMGVQIISGMAYGIDGIGQTAALDAGGRSFSVLGCGVNTCYPLTNRRLYERLKKNGGIISEYGMYTQPQPGLFPPRNRIISALSDAVLVVEAREKSGTMITVDMALEQGRDVAVIPGRIDDPLSTGCIKLWKQGAVPVTDVEDIMCLLDEDRNNACKHKKREKIGLTAEEARVYRILGPYAMSITDIAGRAQMTVRQAVCILVELSVKGLVAESGSGHYVKIRDCEVMRFNP